MKLIGTGVLIDDLFHHDVLDVGAIALF